MAASDANSQGPIFWERLRSLFTRDERTQGGGTGHPRRREVIVVVCLLISCLLWFTFKLQDTYTVTFELPTRITNLPQEEALASQPPQVVRVQVQGQGLDLMQLKLSSPSVLINARREQVNLETAVQVLPSGVSVQSVIPMSLELEKEPRITRRVPIQLRATIRTSPTHDLMARPRIEPDSVTVSGARSIVSDLVYWPTEPLTVEDLTDSLVTRVPLADTLSGLVAHSIEDVRVWAPVQRFTEAVRRLGVRVQGSLGQAVTLEPSVIEVQYRVPVSQYRQAQQAVDFFATVSYDEIRADTSGRIRPEVHYPADLEIRDMQVTPRMLRYYYFIDSD